MNRVRAIHEAIRDELVDACESTTLEVMSGVVADGPGDTMFEIDRISEATLIQRFEELAQEWSFVLIFEGQESKGGVTLPRGADPERAELRIIVDPVDGSRGLMYQKRSAWILTGVAPSRGPATSLADIELAVQTEIPILKQHLCDSLWAIAGCGASGERVNRISGEQVYRPGLWWIGPLRPRRSRGACGD